MWNSQGKSEEEIFKWLDHSLIQLFLRFSRSVTKGVLSIDLKKRKNVKITAKFYRFGRIIARFTLLHCQSSFNSRQIRFKTIRLLNKHFHLRIFHNFTVQHTSILSSSKLVDPTINTHKIFHQFVILKQEKKN